MLHIIKATEEIKTLEFPHILIGGLIGHLEPFRKSAYTGKQIFHLVMIIFRHKLKMPIVGATFTLWHERNTLYG